MPMLNDTFVNYV